MNLISIEFIAFFALSLVVYYIVPKRWQWVTLLAFSAVFFALSSTWYTAGYLIACIVATALCASSIAKRRQADDCKGAKRILLIGIVIDIAFLALLKYSGFLIQNINTVLHVAGVSASVPFLQLEAPIGISFYTFIAVGYLLDVYWGTTEPIGNILQTALLIGYFPQMTSGPISRKNDMDGLYEGHSFDGGRVMFGLERMLC